VTGQSSAKDIAHFYCELAASALVHARHDEARRHLEDALSVNRKCTRANLLLGDVELGAGQVEAAIDAWKRIEGQNPSYLSLVADRLLAAYRRVGRETQGVQLLTGYLSSYPSLDLLESVYKAVLESGGPRQAYELLRDELRRNPTLIGLNRLIEMQISEAPTDKRHDLELTRDLIQQHARSLSLYRCDTSGPGSSTGIAPPVTAGKPTSRNARRRGSCPHE
jgi:lipopolysaccharide biosynthesis regulator YciM